MFQNKTSNLFRSHTASRCIRFVSSNSNEVNFNKINNIGLITLNRPKQLNALTVNMTTSIRSKLIEFELDPQVKAVVIKGNNRSFSAGGDIQILAESLSDKEKLLAVTFGEFRLMSQIARMKKPFLSLSNGITMGAGAGVFFNGKYRVATERTLFAMPETAIGYIPDMGFLRFAHGLKGRSIGLYMALTGARVKGEDVRRVGISSHFVKEAQLEQLEAEIYSSKYVDREIDGLLRKYSSECEGEYEFSSQIDRHFSDKSVEQIFESLKKDNSEWAVKQLTTLSKMSPTAMMLTLRLHREAKGMDFEDFLKLEFNVGMTSLITNSSEFREGVRTVLKDKGDKPKWNPPTIYGFDQTKLDSYFEINPNNPQLDLD